MLSLIFLALYYFYSYKPAVIEINQLENEFVNLTSLEQKLQKKLKTLEKEKLEVEELKRSLQKIINLEEVNSDAITIFLQYIESSNLNITNFNIINQKSNILVLKRTVKIEFEGKFFDIMNFLDIISHDSSVFKIKSLDITRKKEGLLSVVLVCNFYNKER